MFIQPLLFLLTLVSISHRLRCHFDMWSGVWYHTAMTLFMLRSVPSNYIDNMLDNDNDDMVIPWAVHGIYGLQMLYHLMVVAYDPPGQSGLMLWHHVVTLILVGLSWHARHVAIGCVVMLLHDVSDIPLYIVRACRVQQGHRDPHAPNHINAVAGSMLSYIIMWPTLLLSLYSWYQLRLIVFMTIIMRAWRVMATVDMQICVFCLSVLWVMHLYWFLLLLQKVVKTVVS